MELINTVVENHSVFLRNKHAKAIFKSFNKNQKKFIDYLKSGVGENTVAKSLYGTTQSGPSFQAMKSSVQNAFEDIAVVNMVGNALQKSKKKMYKQYAVIKNLDQMGFRPAFVKMAITLLRKCQRLQVHDIAGDLAGMLSTHYAVYEKNLKLGSEYRSLSKTFIELHQAEMDAEWKFTLVYHEAAKKSGINPIVSSLANKTAKEMKANLNPNCCKTYFFYYLVKYAEYYASGDVDNALKICDEALHYLENLSFDHGIVKSTFMIHKIFIYLGKKDFTKVESLIDSVLKYTNQHEPNYIRFMELKLRLKMQNNDNSALKYFNKIGFLKPKYLISDALRERFLIYELYLKLMNNKSAEINIKKIKRKLNELSHGVRNMKIPLLIGELIFLILTGKKDNIIDRAESLKMYKHRNLLKGIHERTSIFLDLLVTNSNNKECEAIITKLKSLPKNIHENELEIIPYELLWDKIKQVNS